MSSQSIATSHDLTPKGSFNKGNPLISGKSRLVKYSNLARHVEPLSCSCYLQKHIELQLAGIVRKGHTPSKTPHQ